MSLKATKQAETNRYELEIVIDAEPFAAAVQAAYKKNVGKMNIPGFRKGHAPRAIIEKMFGSDVFYDDALNDLYPAAVEEAIEQSGLDVIEDKIDFELVSIGKDGVDFKIKVTVKPEVKLGEYKGLKAEKVACKVEDAEVDAELSRLQERNSRVTEVEGRAAEMGDMTVIDFDGYVDGNAFAGGKSEDFSLELGSGQFIPGFEEQVAGHNAGEEFDVNVTFPAEYHAEELAGKPAVFKIKLKEIKKKELPALDDEFAKDVSEFDTLALLKEDIAKKILEGKQAQADGNAENQLIDGLLEGFEAEIPAAMVENRINENIRDFEYRLQSQGLRLEDYKKYTGMDDAAFRDGFREAAEKQVKVRLALEKVAELEKLAPTEEEIAAEYDKFQQSYNVEIERIKAAIPEKEVVGDLSVSKAITFLKDNAVIKEVKAKSEPAAKKPAAKKTAAVAKKTAASAEKKPAAKKTTASAEKKPAAKKPAAKKEKAEKAEKAE